MRYTKLIVWNKFVDFFFKRISCLVVSEELFSCRPDFLGLSIGASPRHMPW